jgi:hypothetical protein
MAMRKVQLYLTEAQYRLLKQRAGKSGSIAQVVRDLVDGTGMPDDPSEDPFIKHVLSDKAPTGDSTSAEEAKRDLYRGTR